MKPFIAKRTDGEKTVRDGTFSLNHSKIDNPQGCISKSQQYQFEVKPAQPAYEVQSQVTQTASQLWEKSQVSLENVASPFGEFTIFHMT